MVDGGDRWLDQEVLFGCLLCLAKGCGVLDAHVTIDEDREDDTLQEMDLII